MAKYLVVHTPKESAKAEEGEVRPPTRLEEMARDLGSESSNPKWVTAWSPDLHDDRLFSLWEASDAKSILEAVEKYGFLDDMAAQPLRVQEWGPSDVLSPAEH
jgi:hypothetical protein